MNLIQRFHLSELSQGIDYSWSFMPYAMRRKFSLMMEFDWCALQTRTFDDDPQIYQFVIIRPQGRKALKKGQSYE